MNRRDLLKGGLALSASGMINLPFPVRIMSQADAATLLSLSQISKLWYPGSTATVSDVLKDVQKRMSNGGFDGSLIVSSIKDNNLSGLYNILETAAVAGVAAVPVVGWVLSTFLSLGFKYLNSTLSTTKDYKDLITSIVNKAIDENNYNLMKAAFSGTTNVYTSYADLISSFQNKTPSSDQHTQLIGKYNDVISSYEQQSPTMLLKDKNGYAYQGLPLFCSLLNIATCASIDILKNKAKLNIDDAFYNQNFTAIETRFFSEHKKIRDTLLHILDNNSQLSHDFPTEWAKRNSLVRGLFLSGLSGVLESYRRRYEAKYFKPIQLRNSIEIYSNSYALQKVLDRDISKDLLKRSSVLSRLTAYTRNDRVQRIGLGYLDSTEGGKGYYTQYEVCSGEVGSGDQKHIDTDFSLNQFSAGNGVGNGSRLPVSITMNATAYATYGIELATSDGKNNILLGQLSGKKEGFYAFGIPGYYLSGLVVNNDNQNGKTCAADSGPSVTLVASVHRHWSSLEYVAEFRNADTGIELDSSVFSLEDNNAKAVKAYADYLIGKNVLEYDPTVDQKPLVFNVYNSTSKNITAAPVLFAASVNPLADFVISVGKTSATITLNHNKNGGTDTGLRSMKGDLFCDGTSESRLTFPPGKSLLTIRGTNNIEIFSFASLLLIPT